MIWIMVLATIERGILNDHVSSINVKEFKTELSCRHYIQALVIKRDDKAVCYVVEVGDD